MKWKRLGSSALALVLVCCLIFNISVPVYADYEYDRAAIMTAEAVVGSVMVGLGLPIGEYLNDKWQSFVQLVDDCVYGLTASGDLNPFMQDGHIVLPCVSKDNGQIVYVAPRLLVDAVWSWLFDSGAVSNGIEVGRLECAYDGYIVETIGGPLFYAYTCYAVSAGYGKYDYRVGVVVTSTNDFQQCTYYPSGKSGTTAVQKAGTAIVEQFPTVYSSIEGLFESLPYPKVPYGERHQWAAGVLSGDYTNLNSSYGLEVGALQMPQQGLEVAYSEWFATMQTLINQQGQQQEYMYLGIAETLEELQGMTQQQIWNGTTTVYQDTTQLGGTTWHKFTTWLSNLLQPLRTVAVTIQDLFQWLLSLPATLGDVFLQVLQTVFVPSEDFLTVKVDAIRAEFGFADGVIVGAEMIRDMFSDLDPEPPVIWIDLNASRGSYDIGDKVKFLDMTWYAEYKPTVDKLLSALIWIVFIWQTFKRLPGIISGVPGDFVMDGIHVLGLEDRLPSRNAAYEIQRRDLRDQIRRGK